jgi:hypothetical protein
VRRPLLIQHTLSLRCAICGSNEKKAHDLHHVQCPLHSQGASLATRPCMCITGVKSPARQLLR